MISSTRMARSFRDREVYFETSMSNCYSCLRMRSRVSSDLLRDERISNGEMFLWKKVHDELFFIVFTYRRIEYYNP